MDLNLVPVGADELFERRGVSGFGQLDQLGIHSPILVPPRLPQVR